MIPIQSTTAADVTRVVVLRNIIHNYTTDTMIILSTTHYTDFAQILCLIAFLYINIML